MIKVGTYLQVLWIRRDHSRNKMGWVLHKLDVLLLHTWSVNLYSMFQTTALSVQVIYDIVDQGSVPAFPGDPVDPIQSRCDPCYSQPCQNGGMCISNMKMISTSSNFVSHAQSDEQFVCECSSLYHGDRCQVIIQNRPWFANNYNF